MAGGGRRCWSRAPARAIAGEKLRAAHSCRVPSLPPAGVRGGAGGRAHPAVAREGGRVPTGRACRRPLLATARPLLAGGQSTSSGWAGLGASPGRCRPCARPTCAPSPCRRRRLRRDVTHLLGAGARLRAIANVARGGTGALRRGLPRARPGRRRRGPHLAAVRVLAANSGQPLKPPHAIVPVGGVAASLGGDPGEVEVAQGLQRRASAQAGAHDQLSVLGPVAADLHDRRRAAAAAAPLPPRAVPDGKRVAVRIWVQLFWSDLEGPFEPVAARSHDGHQDARSVGDASTRPSRAGDPLPGRRSRARPSPSQPPTTLRASSWPS